jgi:hypothetical protein
MTLPRDLVKGACNEPQPWNWRDVCVRKPGHDGDHHAPPRRGYVLAWPGPDGPVRSTGALGPRSYVR